MHRPGSDETFHLDELGACRGPVEGQLGSLQTLPVPHRPRLREASIHHDLDGEAELRLQQVLEVFLQESQGVHGQEGRRVMSPRHSTHPREALLRATNLATSGHDHVWRVSSGRRRHILKLSHGGANLKMYEDLNEMNGTSFPSQHARAKRYETQIRGLSKKVLQMAQKVGAKTKDFWGGFCRSNPELGVPHKFPKFRDARGVLERGVKIQGSGRQSEAFFGEGSAEATQSYGVPHKFLKFRDAHGVLERGVKIQGSGHQSEAFFGEGSAEATQSYGVPHKFLKVRDAHGVLERGVKIQVSGRQSEILVKVPQKQPRAMGSLINSLNFVTPAVS